MFSHSQSINKLYKFFPYFFGGFKKEAVSDKNVANKYLFSLQFSTSSSLLTLDDRGTKANETEEADITKRLSKNFKAVVKDPKKLKQGFINLGGEFKKLFNEQKDRVLNNYALDWEDRTGEIDIAFKFETDQELNRFDVNCDEKIGGFSTAHFKITQNKTGLFYGVLSTDVPKDGNIVYSGYANIMCQRPVKSFERPAYFNWTYYSHIVLKVRGDGRTYTILLATPDKYNFTYNDQYSYPLFTRGGPYWQITKIPFSHFIYAKKTKLQHYLPEIPKAMISRFGITLSDSYDGPFKLEIDYVGLERDETESTCCPYENYD